MGRARRALGDGTRATAFGSRVVQDGRRRRIGRRARADRDRARRSPCSTHGRARLPEDQGLRPQGEIAFNAFDTEPAVARAGRRRASTSRPPGSRRTSSTRACSRVDVASCSLDGTKLSPSRRRSRDAVSFHVHDPGAGRLGTRPVHRAACAASCGPCSSGRSEETLSQIVGIVLVRNEDVFVEQAIRNVAAFCDRIHAVDHVSTDGTWEILRRLDRELRPPRRAAREACRRLAQRSSSRTRAPTPGSSASTATSSTTPSALRGFRAGAARRRVRRRLQGRLERPQLRRARPGGDERRPAISRRPHARSRSSTTSRAIESWRGDGAERLHGGTLVVPRRLRRAARSTTSASVCRGRRHRCAVCTRAFCGDRPRSPSTGAPAGRPILEETGMQDRSWRGRAQATSAPARGAADLRVEAARSTCAATSSRSTRRRSSRSAERVALRGVEPVRGLRPERVVALRQRRERCGRRVRHRREDAWLGCREAAAVEAAGVAEDDRPLRRGERPDRLGGMRCASSSWGG